jgi:hypothetical protein
MQPNQAGQKLPSTPAFLDDTTLVVFGLDHLVTEQEAAPENRRYARKATREGDAYRSHHDVGMSNDLKERAMEYAHHRDHWSSSAAVRPVPVVDEGWVCRFTINPACVATVRTRRFSRSSSAAT